MVKSKRVKKARKVKGAKKPKVDMDTRIYGDSFRFLEERISTECFLGIHEQCFGKLDCECKCHRR